MAGLTDFETVRFGIGGALTGRCAYRLSGGERTAGSPEVYAGKRTLAADKALGAGRSKAVPRAAIFRPAV